jgi:uncharacterized protein (DUF488 family)
MKIYTIGFTKKSAEQFFTKLCQAGVKRIVDVRLNNVSQLAGFAKKPDLRYFADKICGIDYIHLPELAPTQDILDEYKKDKGDWQTYEKKFLELMEKRRIWETVPRNLIENSCFLCSEYNPHQCHRILLAEYLQDKLGNIQIIHI